MCPGELQVRECAAAIFNFNFTIISEGGGYVKRCVSASLPGYSGSEDCVAMETLLQGYDEQDEDQAYRVCNSPLLKYMDNDVSTLTKKVFSRRFT